MAKIVLADGREITHQGGKWSCKDDPILAQMLNMRFPPDSTGVGVVFPFGYLAFYRAVEGLKELGVSSVDGPRVGKLPEGVVS